ncbi:hypothetical protein ACFE04_020455 [Oxalis oulophora]
MEEEEEEEEEEDEKKLLVDVFGESSESDEEKQYKWKAVNGIKGLWLCHNFLSPQQQSSFLSSILNGPIRSVVGTNNRKPAMRFGNLPKWAIELSNSIHDAVRLGNQQSESATFDHCESGDCLLPPHLLCRKPLFDQLIGNSYQPGEGICAHVDLMRFEDGIAIVSLESACVMHFSQVEEGEKSDIEKAKIGVYLSPGSLVVIWGDARYCWKHEINRKPGFQIWEGQELNQKRRISITLRKLCKDDSE